MAQLDFISLFLKQVALRGNSIAIKSEQESITYNELYLKGRKVQCYLEENANQNPFIGIDCADGIDSYSYIIGVWLYGGAYVPINKEYPSRHQEEVKTQTGLKLVLSKEEMLFDQRYVQHNNQCDDQLKLTESEPIVHPTIEQDLAYVIFTSGTTGKPKGVPVSKENLNAFWSHYLDTNTYEFNEQDVFLQSYELSFDVSIFCFSIPLMIGAQLLLPKKKGIKYLNIASAIIKEKVTVCSNVPSVAMHLYTKLDEVDFTSLRYSFFSGEALYGNWALAWMKAAKNAQVYNCYGPTETTIVCTAEHLNSLESSYFLKKEPLPLGTVFKGTGMVIKDKELRFSGGQVFPGYLNVEKQEEECFFPTGDLAFLDKNNCLIFAGRKDQQVQINGYRVELQAIDNCIKEQSGIRSATFALEKELNKLVIVSALETKVSDERMLKGKGIEKLQEKISECLPEYSCPQLYVLIDQFPMNQNGKLDKQKLRQEIERKFQ